MRQKFALDYWTSHPDCKVELECGVAAKILMVEEAGEYPVVCIAEKEGAIPFRTDKNGVAYHVPNNANYSNLFIVTEEPELTPFEECMVEFYNKAEEITRDKDGIRNKKEADEHLHKYSARLLDLAKDQLRKDGYTVEKRNALFDECVAKIDNKLEAEMRVQYGIHAKIKDGDRHAEMRWPEFQKVTQLFYDKGKEEALKDLPRWKRISSSGCIDSDGDHYTPCLCLVNAGWHKVLSEGTKIGGEIFYLSISDLEKLPKEE